MRIGFILCAVVAALIAIEGCSSKSSPNNPKGTSHLLPPVLASPANGSTNQATSLTLTWEKVTGAIIYQVQVSMASTFATVVSNQSILTGLSASISGLSNTTTYYWEVETANANADTISAWSGAWSFTTFNPNTVVPDVPVPVSPKNGATGLLVAPALAWSSGSAGSAGTVASYGVEVSTSVNFGSLIVNQAGVTTLGMMPSGLSNSITYYWRVIATNAIGTSAWMNAWSFTTIKAGFTLAGMVLIPGGTFQMGSTNAALESSDDSSEEPVHSVMVSSFYMDSTLVTQANYTAIMQGGDDAFFDTAVSAPLIPMVNITWYDAVLYCNARSKQMGFDTVYSYTSAYIGDCSPHGGDPGCCYLYGLTMDYTRHGYRLPTEAEWEYACRAGTTTDYYWGESYPPLTSADTAEISAHAWWSANSQDVAQPVATKPANGFGLYDMSGNVWEWCNDLWSGYSSGSQIDPTGPLQNLAVNFSNYNINRGGAAFNDYWPNYLCSAFRQAINAGDWGACGFRCVLR